jgi:hypothetical protein
VAVENPCSLSVEVAYILAAVAVGRAIGHHSRHHRTWYRSQQATKSVYRLSVI